MSFAVAAGTEGNEVEFEAMTIEGSDAISTVADINFKQGALTYWENATGKIWLRAPNAGNLTVLLPSSSGTIALTTDIPNVPVDSVNGQTGVVVLDTGDIDENGNLYTIQRHALQRMRLLQPIPRRLELPPSKLQTLPPTMRRSALLQPKRAR